MKKIQNQIIGFVLAFIGISIFSLGGTMGIGGTNGDDLFFLQLAAYVTGPIIAFIGVYLLIKDRRKLSTEQHQD
ncbi:MAG: hypothetical protein ACFFD4_35500 [Candidatus Odinarchaeota archaeon]